jgi:hypothetical protein
VGLVNVPDRDAAGDPITATEGCNATLPGRFDLTSYIRRTKNNLEFELEAENTCGSNIGWSGLQATYQVRFKKP